MGQIPCSTERISCSSINTVFGSYSNVSNNSMVSLAYEVSLKLFYDLFSTCLEWNNGSYFTADNRDQQLSQTRLHLHTVTTRPGFYGTVQIFNEVSRKIKFLPGTSFYFCSLMLSTYTAFSPQGLSQTLVHWSSHQPNAVSYCACNSFT